MHHCNPGTCKGADPVPCAGDRPGLARMAKIFPGRGGEISQIPPAHRARETLMYNPVDAADTVIHIPGTGQGYPVPLTHFRRVPAIWPGKKREMNSKTGKCKAGDRFR